MNIQYQIHVQLFMNIYMYVYIYIHIHVSKSHYIVQSVFYLCISATFDEGRPKLWPGARLPCWYVEMPTSLDRSVESPLESNGPKICRFDPQNTMFFGRVF